MSVKIIVLSSFYVLDGAEGVASNYQVKQLTQQNDRLKEALVK